MTIEDKILRQQELDRDEPNEKLRASIEDVVAEGDPEMDWDRVEGKLLARIEAEREREKPRGVVWLAVGGAIAAAAAVALLVTGKDQGVPTAPIAEQASAGSFVERRGEGEVHVAGAFAAEGRNIAAGDEIDATGAVGVFDRPGKVRWLLESGSAVKVEHADGPLVLSLERGAAEAQVVPVPNGEAFAIDVTSAQGNVVRVAVHGTHLRVARVGDHVTVDLTEGVVSIGAPPKRGSTLGELVTAPAHVELDVDAMSALHVEHAESSVRKAASLSPEAKVATGTDTPPSPQPTAKLDTPPAVAPLPQKPTALARNPHAGADLSAAVGTCIRQTPHAPDMTVTFSTTLTLQVGDDGYVSRAQFFPALAAQAHDCATAVIYDQKKTRFVDTGTLTLPIEVTY